MTNRIVTAADANVYAEPSPDAPVVGSLRWTEVVEQESTEGAWCQITRAGQPGWVEGEALQDILLFADTYWKRDPWDWRQLYAAPGFHGAMIKATEGVRLPESADWFIQQWPLLGSANLGTKPWTRGAWHYLIFDDPPAQQVDYFLDTLHKAGGFGPGDLPAILDVELGTEGHPNFGASAEQLVESVQGWIEAYKREKHQPVMIYGRQAMVHLDVRSKMGADYLWAPEYNDVLRPGPIEGIGWSAADVQFWQYAGGSSPLAPLPGVAPGLRAGTDMDVFIGGGFDALARLGSSVGLGSPGSR